MDRQWWVVPHTHWDREWYLTFQQFRWKLVKLIDGLLEILEEGPEFTHFMLDGQTIVLEDFLEIRPGNRERLKKLISEGRVSVGPWYLLPDELLISGESVIRNLERGRRIAEQFGSPMGVGYLPDQFGHMGAMPAILHGFGIATACLWRGVGSEVDKTLFWWSHKDGSRVLVLYLFDSYSNGMSLPLELPELTERLRQAGDRLEPAAVGGPLLVMNGSDHLEPQRGLPQALAALAPGDQAVIGSLPGFARAMQPYIKDLPEWTGELRSPQRAPLLVGCTSARHWIKQEDWRLSNLLEVYAEPLAALAAAQGAVYPEGELDLAWKYLLQNQPHDSICGCSIDEVHRDMRYRYDQGIAIAGLAAEQSLRHLAGLCDTAFTGTRGSAVVVYNPGPARESAPVTAGIGGLPPGGAMLVDSDGVRYPMQARAGDPSTAFEVTFSPWQVKMSMGMIKGGRLLHYYLNGASIMQESADTVRIELLVGEHSGGDFDFEAFKATNLPRLDDPSIKKVKIRGTMPGKAEVLFNPGRLPAFGLKALTVVPADSGDRSGASRLSVTRSSLENEFYRIDVERDGSLRVTDKETGIVYAGVNRIVDGGDRGDEYNYDQPAGDRLIDRGRRISSHIEESGPVRATLHIEAVFDLPAALNSDRDRRSRSTVAVRIIRRVSLIPGLKRIEFVTTVDNQASDHRLRVHFGLPGVAAFSDAGCPFEIVRRPADPPRLEPYAEKPIGTHPQRSFVDITDGRAGLAVSSRGVREYEVVRNGDHSELALTLMRCVGWLSLPNLASRPDNAGPQVQTPEAQCRGKWGFEYAMFTHTGDWQKGEVHRFAEAYQSPPMAVAVPVSSGSLPPVISLMDVQGSGLVFSSFRRSQDGQGLSLRFYDVSGLPGQAEVFFGQPVTECRKTRMDEAEGELVPLLEGGRKAGIPYGAYEIVTAMVRMRQPAPTGSGHNLGTINASFSPYF